MRGPPLVSKPLQQGIKHISGAIKGVLGRLARRRRSQALQAASSSALAEPPSDPEAEKSAAEDINSDEEGMAGPIRAKLVNAELGSLLCSIQVPL